MRAAEIIRLVAWRDLRERLRTRAYRISTVVTVVLVAAAVVVPALLDDGGDDGPPSFDVALVGRSSPSVEDAVQVGAARRGATVRFVDLAGRDGVEAALAAGDVDLVVVDGRRAIVQEEGDDGGWQASVAEAVGQAAAMEDAGLEPDQIASVLAAEPVAVRSLRPADEDDLARQGGAFAGSLILYAFLSLYGAWVLYGVAEEKSTRVAEVLLSAVCPSQLLAGKVLGIGAAALLQGTLVLATAVLAAGLAGADLFDVLPPAQLAGLLGWFLLGYAVYSLVYAAAGALVARQEDVQNVATPPALPLLAAYMIAVQAALGGAETTLVRVSSLFPATAPVVMPVRAVMSDVPAWEVALAVVLTLAAIVLLVQVAGRVYARALLRTGGRVRWREALRAS